MRRLRSRESTPLAGSDSFNGDRLDGDASVEWETGNDKNLIRSDSASKMERKVQGLVGKLKSSMKGLSVPLRGGSAKAASVDPEVEAQAAEMFSPQLQPPTDSGPRGGGSDGDGDSTGVLQKGKLGFKMNRFSLPVFASAVGAELRGYGVMESERAPEVELATEGNQGQGPWSSTQGHDPWAASHTQEPWPATPSQDPWAPPQFSCRWDVDQPRHSFSSQSGSYQTMEPKVLEESHGLDEDDWTNSEENVDSGSSLGDRGGIRLGKLKLPSLRRVAEAAADVLRGPTDGMSTHLSAGSRGAGGSLFGDPSAQRHDQRSSTLKERLQHGFKRSSSASAALASLGGSLDPWPARHAGSSHGHLASGAGFEDEYGYRGSELPVKAMP